MRPKLSFSDRFALAILDNSLVRQKTPKSLCAIQKVVLFCQNFSQLGRSSGHGKFKPIATTRIERRERGNGQSLMKR